jgi:hypothetical protein
MRRTDSVVTGSTHGRPRHRDVERGFSAAGRVACFKGFDEASFTFNTKAAPELFDRQFDLMERYLHTGIDLYAYTRSLPPGPVESRTR